MILVLGSAEYAKPFIDLGKTFITSWKSKNIEYDKLQAVVFTGGNDVSPFFYREPFHAETGPVDISRDILEAKIFHKCKARNIPMVGICRGAQFLCALSGGKLIQDVDSHRGFHAMNYEVGNKSGSIRVNSTHHQMMYPWSSKEYKIIGWASCGKHYKGMPAGGPHPHVNRKGQPEFKDPEIVLFPTTKALSIQYHPERLDTVHPAYELAVKLIKEHINA